MNQRNGDRFVLVVCSLILLTFTWLTYRRNETWRSEVQIWEAAVRSSPLKPRPRINLAHALTKTNNPDVYERALREYDNALVLAQFRGDEHDIRVAHLLASIDGSDLLIRMQRYDDAQVVAQRGWDEFPGFPGLAINLSNLYLRRGDTARAVQVLAQALNNHHSDYPWFPEIDYSGLYRNLALAFMLTGECDKAHAVEAEADRIDREPMHLTDDCQPPSTSKNSS